MTSNSQIHNDEVNLVELAKAVWEGKWKIAVVVIISIIATTVYQSTIKDNFTAITEIKPLSPVERNKYLPLENYYFSFDNFILLTTNNSSTGIEFENEEEDYDANNRNRIYKIDSSNFLDLYLSVMNNKSVI